MIQAAVTDLAQTLDSGVAPITLLLQPIRDCTNGIPRAYRTVQQVNSVRLGVLLPEQYRHVADRTAQSLALLRLNLLSAFRVLRQMEEKMLMPAFLTVYAPATKSPTASLATLVREAADACGVSDCSHICIEFPEEILYLEEETVSPMLQQLREIGVRTAVSGVGGSFSPIGRVFTFSFDYCFLDPALTTKAEDHIADPAARAMLAALGTSRTALIAEGVSDENQIRFLTDAGCYGYILQKDVPAPVEEPV